MVIAKFNHSTARELCKDMMEAVKGVADKYGIEVRSEGVSFLPAEASVKFHVYPQQLADDLEIRKVSSYKSRFKRHRLPELYSTVKTPDGREWIIEGWNSRANKKPVMLFDDNTGDELRTSPAYIRNACTVVV